MSVSLQPSEDVTWTKDLHVDYQLSVTCKTTDVKLLDLAASEKRFGMQLKAACRARGLNPTTSGKSGYYVSLVRPSRKVVAINNLWVQSPPEVLYINKLKGKGTFATCDIQAGQLICEYLGDIIDQAEKTVRDEQYLRDGVAYKFIELTHGKFIDGCRDRYGSVLSAEDNPGATMNHCRSSPNCRLVRLLADGRYVLKAITGISRRGECTWNYGDTSNDLDSWYYE